MFQAILRVQWVRVRAALVLLALVAFTLPLLMVSSGGALGLGESLGAEAVARWLSAAGEIGRVVPVLALAIGVYLGVMAWADDHRGQHVYALSLPLSRERFVLMRFGAVLALMAVPVAALTVGTLIATAAVSLPAGLHAYPFAFAGRFLLGTLLCLALFFTIAIATRRAVVITLGMIAALMLAQFFMELLGVQYGLLERVLLLLTIWPSPFEVLTGRWALFDV
jgi:hypothetical protein